MSRLVAVLVAPWESNPDFSKLEHIRRTRRLSDQLVWTLQNEMSGGGLFYESLSVQDPCLEKAVVDYSRQNGLESTKDHRQTVEHP